jgi:nitroreductase
MNPADFNELVKNRRAIFTKSYNKKPIAREIVTQVLENAHWAPTHKLTEPWRFKVLRGKALKEFSAFLAKDYVKHTPLAKQSDLGMKKFAENPLNANTVILLCVQRDPETRVPEWEELAATAAAVQNMWLTCTAYNIGAYWSTPGVMNRMSDFIQLAHGEKCIGIFYMGNTDLPQQAGKRTPVEDKIEWLPEE